MIHALIHLPALGQEQVPELVLAPTGVLAVLVPITPVVAEFVIMTGLNNVARDLPIGFVMLIKGVINQLMEFLQLMAVLDKWPPSNPK